MDRLPAPSKKVFSKSRICLLGIISTYLILGFLYARFTPAWQAPDEPAHYNFIRFLATQKSLPVLKIGDYDQNLIAKATANRFPPGIPLEDFRYEGHQPPLYYLMAVPWYWLWDGALLPLRLFSLLLGTGVPVIAYLIGRRLFLNQAAISLGAAALIAFLPQHLSMMSAVNNDALAELLVGLILLFSLQEGRGEGKSITRILMGFFLGLGLVTKASVYGTVPVVGMALVLGWFKSNRGGLREFFTERMVPVLTPALLIALPWWWRNLTVYGWPDFLGMIRHQNVVLGQPKTMDWISTYGLQDWAKRFFRFTFQSFWGQFGWMGVLLKPSIYQALFLFSWLAGLGLIWGLMQKGFKAFGTEKILLSLLAAMTALGFVGYNSMFVQHQGRYLYPALIPLALGASVGLKRILEPEVAKGVSFSILLIWVPIFLFGFLKKNWDLWPVLQGLTVVCVLFFIPQGNFFRTRWVYPIPFIALAGLAVYSLFGFIIPQLR